MVDEPVVPVDDFALDLLEESLKYHFVGIGPDGPIGSGGLSFYQLMKFWSGYDPELLEQEIGGSVYHGVILGHGDVIQALIEEIRRLRNDQQ